MPIYRIPEQHIFPDPWRAEPNGLLGVGGDLDPDRLLLAYRMGIFPWYSEGQPILWWAPDPRFVLFPDELHIGRSLAKRMRRGDYEIRMDTAFEQVMRACGEAPRPGQDGTWITDEMVDGYVGLHERGLAHSVEAWKDDELVGGLYGVAVGGLFAGESMFAHAPDASKVAFATFVQQLRDWNFELIDCQMHTEHLERFGARDIPRMDYLRHLQRLHHTPERVGPWRFDQKK
ncbi:MAG: leucyl/phenylalanyl-tRNA--protein transferase [Proteobacteria bacterium]|nr:leucyl/phenylalanyl-tRNA--protein transferase [Pseudomonadota bacterium]